MKNLKNNPLSIFFNDPKILKQYEKDIKASDLKEKAKFKSFLSKREKLYKAYKKDKLKYFTSKKIDRKAITKLNNAFNESIDALYLKTMFVKESKPIKKRKNTDYFPRRFVLPTSLAHEKFSGGWPIDSVRNHSPGFDQGSVDTYAKLSEDDGQIVTSSAFHLVESDDSDSATSKTSPFFGFFYIPSESGILILNFDINVFNSTISSRNYNEGGHSEVSIHRKMVIPKVRIWKAGNVVPDWILLFGTRRRQSGDTSLRQVNNIDHRALMDFRHDSGTRSHQLQSVVAGSLYIVNFGFDIIHEVVVDDVTISSFAMDHFRVEKIGLNVI